MRPPRGVRGRGRARGVHQDESEAAEVIRPLPRVRTRGGRDQGRGRGHAEVHRQEEEHAFVDDIPLDEVMRSLPRIRTRVGKGRGRGRAKAKVPRQQEQDAVFEDEPEDQVIEQPQELVIAPTEESVIQQPQPQEEVIAPTEEPVIQQPQSQEEVIRGRRRGRGRGRVEAQQHDDVPLDVGGPENLSLLKSFRTHVAKAILEGEERGTLRLHQHMGLLGTWVVTEDRFKEKVLNSGLLPLCRINKNSHCNSFRISAFVERWHPETNTFHFDFGEMGLTLDDVEHLLGIPVRGLPVYTEDERTPEQLLIDLLGVSEEVAKNAVTVKEKTRYAVKLSWLEMNFKEVNETDSDERVVCCARAYLLYVIGCTLFCDKSGGFVQLDLLPLLEDLDKVHTYGWGASCLAFLYRNLGYASRRNAKQVGGFLILLEAWINEHFPTLHPVVDPEYTEDLPRARRWCLHSETGTSVQH